MSRLRERLEHGKRQGSEWKKSGSEQNDVKEVEAIAKGGWRFVQRNKGWGAAASQATTVTPAPYACSIQELKESFNKAAPLRSSVDFLAHMNSVDRSISNRRDRTFTSDHCLTAASSPNKLEKAPLLRSFYSTSQELEDSQLASMQGFRRVHSRSQSTKLKSTPTKLKITLPCPKLAPSPLVLKSRQSIQRDLHVTMVQSQQFMRSANSLCRRLNQYFLKAPVIHPKSFILAL